MSLTIPCACGGGYVLKRACWVADDWGSEPSSVDLGWMEAPCPMCNGTGRAGPPPWPLKPADDAWRPADPARVAELEANLDRLYGTVEQ